MSSRVGVTGHIYIKDPMPLTKKSRTSYPSGKFPPGFIHQVIIIIGLNKLMTVFPALKMALDTNRA